MKRCPECRRDYYDDTLLYCLDDGNALLEGPASGSRSEPPASAGGQFGDEPQTAILHSTDAQGEAPTRAQIHTTEQTAVLHRGAEAEPRESLGGLSERQSLSAHRAAKPQLLANRAAKPLIAAAVAVAVLLGGFFGYRYFSTAGGGQINSIAVLPFENRSGSGDTEYLSDGLADSLIFRLSQLPNLMVSPTSSVMRYKGKGGDTSQIARELNVDAVMSGRLVQIGDSLNISVQLIDARTDKLIWAEQYDRKMSDLLATQREIAMAITEKLQLKLSGEERGITKKYTDSNEAYQLYLKGRYHYAKRTRADVEKSIEYFQQAVKLDPNFALAYAMMSDAFSSMPAYPYLSPKEAFPQAKTAAVRAIEIDPSLPEAHAAMGYYLALGEWKWAEAERSFERAIELDPKNALVHLRFAISYYQPMGLIDEAVRQNQIAMELEPLNLVTGANLTWSYILAGRTEEAVAQGRKVVDLDPNFMLGRYQLGLAYISDGKYQEALVLTEKPLADNPKDQYMLQVAGFANAKLGRPAESKAVIERFREISRSEYVMSFFVATIHAGLGDKEAAFAEMEKAYQERDWRMSTLIKTDPMIKTLRADSRYRDLLKRMNLPE